MMREQASRNFDVRGTFPEILMHILNLADQDRQVAECISWNPTGTAFYVHNSELLEQNILPRFFPATKYASFTRKLNRWGLKQVNDGVDEGGYKHALFQRASPSLCLRMEHKYKKQCRQRSIRATSTKTKEASITSQGQVRNRNVSPETVDKSLCGISPPSFSMTKGLLPSESQKSGTFEGKVESSSTVVLRSLHNAVAGVFSALQTRGNAILPTKHRSSVTGVSGVVNQRFVDKYFCKLPKTLSLETQPETCSNMTEHWNDLSLNTPGDNKYRN